MVIELSTPTLIAEGTRIQGALTFFSTAEVFGLIEGELIQQSLDRLQIGRQGWVNGSISSQGPVLIEGRVDGNIQSATTIRLMPTANVRGRLIAPSIEIRPGAIFEGDFVMRTSKGKSEGLKNAA